MVPFRALERLADKAYLALRASIRDGIFKPGQRMSEIPLAKGLAMSRTPVREALRRLQSEQLVVKLACGGVAVAQHERHALGELCEARRSLEGYAARLASHHARPADLITMRAIVARFAKSSDPAAHLSGDRKLHEQIFRAADNRFLLRQAMGLYDVAASLYQPPWDAEVAARIHTEHNAIILAIEQRNAEQAEFLMRKHVEHGFDRGSSTEEAGPVEVEHDASCGLSGELAC